MEPKLSMGSMLTQSEIEIYGIVQSTQRLEKFGFRPEVTLLSTSEYYKAWEKMAVARSAKPSRADLYDVADGIQGALGLRSRNSTLVNNHPPPFKLGSHVVSELTWLLGNTRL
jgi:hypothetical protein